MVTHAPIIVGSAPSSGSTLLVNLIGRIPGIYQTNELSIFDKPDWFSMTPTELMEQWPIISTRGYPRRLGCEMRPVFTGIRRSSWPAPRPGEDYLTFLMRYMDDQIQTHGCRRWVEKTPANIFSLQQLKRIAPEAQFVVIMRDARAVIKSLIRRGYSPVLAVARWYLSSLKIHALGEDPRVLLLKYEELVTSPSQTTRRLMKFINEPFSHEVLEPIEGEKPVPTWSASPNDMIRPVALWQERDVLDSRAVAAFLSMRATPDFEEELGLSGSAPTPAELQAIFGYASVSAILDGYHYARNRMTMAVDFARYSLSMLVHMQLPQRAPYFLAKYSRFF